MPSWKARIIQSRERQELHFAPELLRLKGVILLELNRPGEGEACLEEAIGLAHEQGARMLELRATVSAVPEWVRTDRTAMARERLRELYVTFTEGLATRDLRAARELLSQLDGAPGTEPGDPSRLASI